MNSKIALWSLAAILCLASGAGADALQCGRWKEKTSGPCEAQGSGVRCLASGEPTACVVVKPKKAGAMVSFTYEEWHSKCNFAGGKVQADQLIVGAGGLEIPLLSPGSDISCRESFLQSCTVGGEAKACSDVLTVELRQYNGNKQ